LLLHNTSGEAERVQEDSAVSCTTMTTRSQRRSRTCRHTSGTCTVQCLENSEVSADGMHCRANDVAKEKVVTRNHGKRYQGKQENRGKQEKKQTGRSQSKNSAKPTKSGFLRQQVSFLFGTIVCFCIYFIKYYAAEI